MADLRARRPPGTWCWLPLFVLLALATALAVGLWLSALNVLYRDVQLRHPVPASSSGCSCSPVIYPSTTFDEPRCDFLYALNPMAGVIEGFRWALLGRDAAQRHRPCVSTVIVIAAARDRAALLQAHGAHLRGRGLSHERRQRPGRGPRQAVPHRRRRSRRYRTLRDTLVRAVQAAHRAHPPPRAPPRTSADDALGAARRLLRGAGGRGRSGIIGATAPARARCSRSSRASPSRPRAASSSTAASGACSRSAPASTPS